jgi:hypothetical protein
MELCQNLRNGTKSGLYAWSYSTIRSLLSWKHIHINCHLNFHADTRNELTFAHTTFGSFVKSLINHLLKTPEYVCQGLFIL